MYRTSWCAALVFSFGCSEVLFTPITDRAVGPDDTGADPWGEGCTFAAPPVYAVARDETCKDEPVVGTFTPVVEWNWNKNPVHSWYHMVMMTPVVAHLTDDNEDGVIGSGDIPDVVTTAFRFDDYRDEGTLNIVAGDTGQTLASWSSFEGCRPEGTSGVAVGDLDGDGEPTIVLLTSCGLTAVDRFGQLEWTAPVPAGEYWGYLWSPSLADIDADGRSEIIWGRSVFDADGNEVWTGTGWTGNGISFAVDMDGDGVMEVVAGSTVYESTGEIRWDGGVEGFSAVADFDMDGNPEVLVVSYSGVVYLFSNGGVLEWRADFPADTRAGAPTIADYDGDGLPEVGIAFKTAYRVLDGDGSEMWSQPTEDDSSGVTGSAVFDFEGDGAAEVVYADEHVLYIYDGATGAIELAYEDHASGTLTEYPVIVDVDADGSTEIVLASNNMWWSGNTGITVIGDKDDSWAPARQVWNQHAYHITNVEDTGEIPVHAEANWLDYNSFRAGNSETSVGLSRSDLHIGEPEVCLDECLWGHAVVYIPLENGGLADADIVDVTLYQMDGVTVSSAVETWTVPVVQQGQSTWIGPLNIPVSAIGDGAGLLRVDDDGAGTGRHDECDESNNDYILPAHPCFE